VTRFHAARVAARIRKELGQPVEQIAGDYGEFTVSIDGTEVLSAGSFGWMGVLPDSRRVVARVREALEATPGGETPGSPRES
jgi:hypothetical protein